MKKTLVSLAALAAFTALVYAETKIGVINPQLVLQKSAKAQEKVERLRVLEQKKQKEYETLQKQIETLEKEVMSPALNAETRDRKGRELETKRTELKRFTEDAQRELVAEQQKEFDALKTELMPIIEKVAKQLGYALILDLNTAGIAYMDNALDITDNVIELYDSRTPAATKK